jgi:hypothetical protein
MRQRHTDKPSAKEKRARIEEGRNDFAAGISTSQCPYNRDTFGYEWWLHGWWGAYYKQRGKRIAAGELCEFCAGPMSNVTTGVFVIAKHGTTKTVCGKCKDDLVYWDDYQVMAQARSLTIGQTEEDVY